MQSQFIGELDAKNLEGKWWRLNHPLAFYSSRYDITVCAPPGFVTDFASVPRVPMAYLIAGNTGNWESLIHDLLYRFFYKRLMFELIFFDAGRVRSASRENQHFLYRSGRLVRISLMTIFTTGFGWIVHDPIPGCLDHRNKRTCGRNCIECKNYYPAWYLCKMHGYKPEILDIHGAN